MRLKVMLCGASMLLTSGLGSSGAAEPSFYKAELLFLKVPTTSSRLQAAEFVASKNGSGGPLLVRGPFSMSWGEDTLASDGLIVRLNGRDLWEGRDEAADPRAAVAVMSAPRVTSVLGQSAQIKVGLQIPATGVQFMVRDADGRFTLRTLDRTPEWDIELKASRAATPGVLRLEWNHRLVRLGRRNTITGVSLDVGAPEVIEESGRSAEDVKIGQWCFLAIGEGDKAPGLAVLLRLRLAE